MKVAIYARVSTSDQNPEAQLTQLRDYAATRSFTIHREYVDQITGAVEKRKKRDTAYQQLLDDAQRLKFKCVLVWKFDRFARSVSHLLRALETFNSLGIAFVSLGEQIDTSTPAGRMVFTVLGAVAELERSLIAERVRAGMRNARAKGKCIGRPPRTQLSPEDRKSIAEGYWCRKASFRQLARRFDTSIGTVQRCALAYRKDYAAAPGTR